MGVIICMLFCNHCACILKNIIIWQQELFNKHMVCVVVQLKRGMFKREAFLEKTLVISWMPSLLVTLADT